MKKLIQQITFFILPIVLVLLCIEMFYRVVPNNYTIKNENIQQNYDNTEVLIFGNSHTFYGLNPKFFDKSTFNISNISQTLYFDQLLFEKHIDQLKKLKYVVLNVEYTTLSQLDNTVEDVWRKYYYKSYMDLRVPSLSEFDPKSYFLSSTRSFNVNVKLMGRYFSEETIVDCDKNGFGVNYTKEKRLLKIGKTAPITIRKHEDNLLDFSNNVSRILSIVDKCKRKKIQVIIVTMPVSKEYAQGVNQLKLQKIAKTCLSIEKGNANVHYLNLFKDSRFTNDDFFDSDHLHNQGAKKCSKIVSGFLNDLIL